MQTIKFCTTEHSLNLADNVMDEIQNQSLNGIDVIPTSSDVPMAWDAGFEIHESDLVVIGGVGPSGFGEISIRLPLKDQYCYTFEIDFDDDLYDLRFIIEALVKSHYQIT